MKQFIDPSTLMLGSRTCLGFLKCYNIRISEEHKVYTLKKALYVLKPASRAWYSHIDSNFMEEGCQRCPYEHTLYIRYNKGDIYIVCLYVDDLILLEALRLCLRNLRNP